MPNTLAGLRDADGQIKIKYLVLAGWLYVYHVGLHVLLQVCVTQSSVPIVSDVSSIHDLPKEVVKIFPGHLWVSRQASHSQYRCPPVLLPPCEDSSSRAILHCIDVEACKILKSTLLTMNKQIHKYRKHVRHFG